MDKKIIAGVATVLISSMSIATIVFAQKQETKSFCVGGGCIIPPYPSRPKYPDITLAQGVAVDKTNLETEPVVFLIVKYRGDSNTYLFLDNEFYKLTEVNKIDDWESGTKIFQYKADNGDIMTVVIQHFDSYGFVSVSANFQNYLITFEPIYKYRSGPMPATGAIKGIPEYEQIAKKLTQKVGINISDIFSGNAGQIEEWTK